MRQTEIEQKRERGIYSLFMSQANELSPLQLKAKNN